MKKITKRFLGNAFRWRGLIIGSILNCVFIGANAQNNMNQEIIVEVEAVKTYSTYKAHNSFFFLFKITKVLKGNIKDSLLVSQEIFSDFGGKQIREKLEGNKVLLKIDADPLKEEIFLPEELVKEKIAGRSVVLLWVCEPDRMESMERLERKLASLSNGGNTWVNLLAESKGKLFYKENGISKIAVELFPGYWITATVDPEK